MRSLYWKIFISFWLATILIILTTAWITSALTHKSSIPEHEKVFMDSHATAAITTLESGHSKALIHWMESVGKRSNITLYLLSNTGRIYSNALPTPEVKKIAEDLVHERLNDGLLKFDHLIVSHEIISLTGHTYRLVAVSEQPLAHHLTIPWAGLSIRLAIAVFFSGLVCYLLSLYLTRPLRYLGQAAKSLASGQLHTRVGYIRGHGNDEIAVLSHDFDRMAERLETFIRTKERLLSDISHELRSPLARLQIALEIGRKKSPEHAMQEFDRIEMECIRLNQLISEILEFARLDKSASDLRLTAVDTAQLLQSIIEDANYEFSRKHTTVQLTKKESVILMADQRLLHRAIENVVRNALRYSPKNALVMINMLIEKNEVLHIDVEDQGPGIPEDELNKIFAPFYRVDASREKKSGGYGLGLSIALKAIQLHNGTITAYNLKDAGLRVRITLPIPCQD